MKQVDGRGCRGVKPPTLELRGVHRAYGAREVLRGVDLAVPAGALLTLTGRSGSGKSTILRLAAGLDRPSSGEVLIEGRDIAKLDDAELSRIRLRRLGIVFQSANLLPDLTVMQNVRLPLDLAGVPRGRGDERVRDLLRLVGLGDHAAARPASLSGGEAQRVAFARSLANEPAILLADEPTAALDSENAATVLDTIEDIHAARGASILLVTHDPLVMGRFGERLHIEDGRLVPPSGP